MMKRKKKITKISQFLGGVHPYQRSKKEADGVKGTPKAEGFERCVVCGELTAVPVSMPIELREGYVVGCGQLCNSCNGLLQAETETMFLAEQILQAQNNAESTD